MSPFLHLEHNSVKLKSQLQICRRNSVTSKFPAEFKSDKSGVSGIPLDVTLIRNLMSFQKFQASFNYC